MDWLFGEVGELGLWWVERYTFIQKDGGEKRKTESHYRGLPVWEADLRVNLFSCLTSWSPSKTNRVTKQSNQTVMLDKYTCPLNGYTPPELSFSFMVTSKVRKITFFVSLVNIIPIPSGDGNVLFQQVQIKWYMSKCCLLRCYFYVIITASGIATRGSANGNCTEAQHRTTFSQSPFWVKGIRCWKFYQ